MRYCIKCFDNSDNNVVSLVVDESILFETVENFGKVYTVKAYVLSDDSEVK